MEDHGKIGTDLASLARLAAAGQSEDVRLYLAKLVRKYRRLDPSLATELDQVLRTTQSSSERSSGVLRKGPSQLQSDEFIPRIADQESGLSLLKTFDDRGNDLDPLLASEVMASLNAIVDERRQLERLTAAGLRATRSVVFVGPPGVGKTLSARWIAASLGKPLQVLDLTAVMSSLLGRTGQNIRSVLDYAKRNECILLLDELDSIAKRRGDDSDIGELKRVVTVMLQEIEDWPPLSLLISATNHPELVDPAIWRRFDSVVKFPQPNRAHIERAVARFLGPDHDRLSRFVSTLALIFEGLSLSEVERSVDKMRRRIALSEPSAGELIKQVVDDRIPPLNKEERQRLAFALGEAGELSHLEIHQITGVSRDTIRKKTGPSKKPVGRGKKT